MGIEKPCCDEPPAPGAAALFALDGSPLPDGAQLRVGVVVTDGAGEFVQALAFGSVIAVSVVPAGGAFAVEFTATPAGIAGRVVTRSLTDLLGRRAQPAPGVAVHIFAVGVP